MTWVGIGLIIIGIALLALSIFLVKPLAKVSSILSDLKKTTKDLPQVAENTTREVNDALHTGVDTLKEINGQLKELTPIFHLVGDVGRATHQIASNMVNAVEDFERKETIASRKNLEGLYGLVTLSIILFQKLRGYSKERKIIDVAE